jgi:5,5'-dehydrodivanillate O-demethylase
MLNAVQNDAITRVGKGTPMGVLMRRYWHPIAASVELVVDRGGRPTKQVRLLGEDQVRRAAGKRGEHREDLGHVVG